MLSNAPRSFNLPFDHIVLQKLKSRGIEIDLKTGHLLYAKEFKPLILNYELVFIRHGETYGNCGQITAFGKIDQEAVKKGLKNPQNRIFQGDVDEEINQLTELGKSQALKAAYHLENELLAKLWMPDIIFYSPLTRAKETAIPFVNRNLLQNRFFCDPRLKEISFGSWENQRICDFNPEDECHSFYQNQNALIKAESKDCNGKIQQAESFCELLIRVHDFLSNLNEKHPKKKIIIYSHSMFGAACAILLGKGQVNKKENYIMFDGKHPNGEPCALPHAVPLKLNF